MTITLWLMASFLGVLLLGTANTAMKHIANSYQNNYTALLLQYISMAFFALLFVTSISLYMGTPIFPSLDVVSRWALLAVGIFGFVGIVFLFKAFDNLSGGVTLIIANLSVFLMYFANLFLFDSSESLGILQVILAILFFVTVAQFLWTKSTHDKKSSKTHMNWKVLYPVVTAICWTVFFVGNTWFVKNEIMTPVQSVFATESIIFVIALIYYAVAYKRDFSDIGKSCCGAHIVPLMLIGFCNVGANFLFYFAYLDNPANIVNFIRLFSIIASAILSWVFLKDYLTKKQLLLMLCAFIILIAFIFGENISSLLWV